MINYTKYSFFGMTFYNKISPAGEKIKSIRKNVKPRNEVEEIFLFTKGKYVVTDEDGLSHNYIERVPGVYSEELNPFERGIYYITAQEDSEWWCVNRSDLIKNNFKLKKIDRSANQILSLKANTKYVFFTGKFLYDAGNGVNKSIQAPVPLNNTSAKDVLVTDRILGYELESV